MEPKFVKETLPLSFPLQVEQMTQKDSRIKLLNEVLNGIKVIKFYAWETPFKELIKKIRGGEVVALRKFTLLNAAYAFTWTCAPFAVSPLPIQGRSKQSGYSHLFL